MKIACFLALITLSIRFTRQSPTQKFLFFIRSEYFIFITLKASLKKNLLRSNSNGGTEGVRERKKNLDSNMNKRQKLDRNWITQVKRRTNGRIENGSTKKETGFNRPISVETPSFIAIINVVNRL